MIIYFGSIAKAAVLGLAVAAVSVCVPSVWQLGSCELANIELRDDLRDLASQAGSRIGLNSPRSDGDLRNIILRDAERYDIDLAPDQIFIDRSVSDDSSSIYIGVDYTVQIRLPGHSLSIHFNPSSR